MTTNFEKIKSFFKQIKIDTFHLIFLCCGLITAFVSLFLIGYIFYTAYPVLSEVGVINFITGDRWDYSDHVYGIKIYIIGTIAMTLLTMAMAIPISVFTAIYLSEFASERMAYIVRSFVELLVGIPSVVYGVFGLFILEDVFQNVIDPLISSKLGFISFFSDPNPTTGAGLLLASSILTVMIIPTIISLSEDAIRSVPHDYRLGSFAMGATQWETIRNVVLPVASGGIISAFVLGMMRAMGETMAIAMLIGGLDKIPDSILSGSYAMTSKILADIGYYVAFDEPRSALFGIAAVLFTIEILFVGIARKIGGRT